MKRTLLFALLFSPFIVFSQLTPKPAGPGHAVGFYEFLPPGYNALGAYNYPVIINMHGVGERGNGTTDLPLVLTWALARLLNNGATMKFTVGGQQHAFIVLSPQLSPVYQNWQNFYVDSMINYAIANLKVDVNKIFLTGYSLGGGGAWKYPTASVDSANRIAGIIPVSPAPDYTTLCNIASGRVAVWAHHSMDDSAIPVHFTEDAINGINACAPGIPALATYYQFGEHGGPWDWAYDTLNNYQYPNMFQWMIGTSRANTPGNNLNPVASAGNDTVIILPSTRAILNGAGSNDPNDVLVSYAWTKVAGPDTFTIEKPNFPVTNLTGMVRGNYTFRLTVKDQFGVVRFDEVKINDTLPLDGSNAVPFVSAGPDISNSKDSVIFFGMDHDYDGTVASREWRFLSGPVTPTLGFRFSNTFDVHAMSTVGIYRFEYGVVDDDGGIAKDTVNYTKMAALPVTIVYFKGKNTGTANALSWATGNEINASHFEILRSTDGHQFLRIGIVGSGIQEYSFLDREAPKGISYYRLRQVDKDGHSTLSPIIKIDNISRILVMEKYPNPTGDKLNVVINGDLYGSMELSIHDMQGGLVHKQFVHKQQFEWKGSVNVGHLLKGVYTIQIQTNRGTRETGTFVKQ